MRNDFYVGMYEDRYLAHGVKGWIKKGHKYIERIFKGGKWRYIYDAARYSTASHLKDTQGKTLDSTGYFKGQAQKNYRDAERYGRLAGNAEAYARQATLSKKAANKNAERLNKYKAALKKGGQKAQEQYDKLNDIAWRNLIFKDGRRTLRDTKKWNKENDKLPEAKKYVGKNQVKKYTPQETKVNYNPTFSKKVMQKKKADELRAREQEAKERGYKTHKTPPRQSTVNAADPYRYRDQIDQNSREVNQAIKKDSVAWKSAYNKYKRYYDEETAKLMAYRATSAGYGEDKYGAVDAVFKNDSLRMKENNYNKKKTQHPNLVRRKKNTRTKKSSVNKRK